MEHLYETVIIGGGPAGLTAALYATRAGLSTLILEKLAHGGQMGKTSEIDNYPGFDCGVDGYRLGEKMHAAAQRFGAETVMAEVTSVALGESPKRIETTAGTFWGKTVIIATGAKHKQLGLAREGELVGRGVGYCAACDGMFYRGKTVAVVGGGNSAAADALTLSRICNKVILIHRRSSLRASKIYQDQLLQADNIEICRNHTVSALLGAEKLWGIELTNTQTGEVEQLAVEGLFISIGLSPETELFQGQLELDGGYIVADETTHTDLPGVFAAGDVRSKPLRQIVTATADGAVAAYYAEKFLSRE